MKNKIKDATLRNQTVVITGASSGIGKATAIAFAREGADLVLAARGLQGLEETASMCRKSGVMVKVVATDMSDAKQVQQLVKEALSINGYIKCWVNNAGVLSFGKFEETPVEVIGQVIKTNLLGYVYGARAILPVFKQQGEGVLINNISIGGWMPAPYGTAYTASKYGIRGLVEGLQAEVANEPHIHICALYPGFQRSAGIGHAANYSGIRLSTPPPAFNPRRLAYAMVQMAKHPVAAAYPDWFGLLFKRLYQVCPAVIRTVSSFAMRGAMKWANKTEHTDGIVLYPSKGYNGIYGKTLLSTSLPLPKRMVVTVLGITAMSIWLASRSRRVK
ncbi:SDR family oxidoreductase [Niabella yanshanensis]|uniref:SDR family oxidoreductase n=1 Tax=Niabella yanshanensis TaxID=577386 RepID=A0ABZ0WA25_9BACT|nr:SDR family oxidoreductase [Niabella yanshanensis]WQD38387.1 SDR family oxidoreductase [Niabella yanshanensis]